MEPWTSFPSANSSLLNFLDVTSPILYITTLPGYILHYFHAVLHLTSIHLSYIRSSACEKLYVLLRGSQFYYPAGFFSLTAPMTYLDSCFQSKGILNQLSWWLSKANCVLWRSQWTINAARLSLYHDLHSLAILENNQILLSYSNGRYPDIEYHRPDIK